MGFFNFYYFIFFTLFLNLALMFNTGTLNEQYINISKCNKSGVGADFLSGHLTNSHNSDKTFKTI